MDARQATGKKESILNLDKHLDKRVRVKFTGGREGKALAGARRTGHKFSMFFFFFNLFIYCSCRNAERL